MALSRHLSLRGLCVLLLGTMVGGQGKGCPSVLGPQQGVDALVKGKVSGLVEPGLSVFERKGTTVTVNTGPSPVRATLVVAADFTEQ